MCKIILTCQCFDHYSVFSFEGEKLSVVGSPFWMAPEVLRDEPYNEKVRFSAVAGTLHYHKACFMPASIKTHNHFSVLITRLMSFRMALFCVRSLQGYRLILTTYRALK